MTDIERTECDETKGQLELSLAELTEKVNGIINHQTQLVERLAQMNINYIAVLGQIDSLIRTTQLLNDRDNNTINLIKAISEFNSVV